MRKIVLGVLCLALSLSACGAANTLVLRPTTPAPVEAVPTAQLESTIYKRLLLLPPEKGVSVAADVDVTLARERDGAHYMGRLEKYFLGQGFEVVSQEIVARLGRKAQAGSSAAARALMMGKETHADAVLMVQSLSVHGGEKFFHIEDLSEVEPGLRVEDDGEYRHRETEECLFRLPYYELRIEAKMIDVRSGDVLWVGSARETTIDALEESWTAKLDDDCGIEEQSPFIYRDQLHAEETFDRTVAQLYERTFGGLKRSALAGKPREREPAKVAEPAPPPPPPPPPPKVEEPPPAPAPKMAVVSSNQGVLRVGPDKRDKKVRVVPRKAKVEVLETMGTWHKVKVQDGTVGWMHEGSLIFPD
jgi:hypothetical protein